MNAFESLISMLLRHNGFWTNPSFKVELTKEEKRLIGRHSAPRWELDIVAYKGATNEVLIVECKSFLDSGGVDFRNGQFRRPKLYKLFTEKVLREVVLKRLEQQLVERGSISPSPRKQLCLAVGKLARNTNLEQIKEHFAEKDWQLMDPD